MSTQHPEALRLRDLANTICNNQSLPLDVRQLAFVLAAGFVEQHNRITELEAQLEAVGAGGVGPLIACAGFSSADMATAAAQGFRDGAAKEQQAGWQPIETAPKDGAEILLGRAESEDMDRPAISTPGYWQEGYEDGVDYMGCDSGFVDSHHQVFDGGRSFGAESHRYAPNQPTHWMPLPAPPSSAQREMSQ